MDHFIPCIAKHNLQPLHKKPGAHSKSIKNRFHKEFAEYLLLSLLGLCVAAKTNQLKEGIGVKLNNVDEL